MCTVVARCALSFAASLLGVSSALGQESARKSGPTPAPRSALAEAGNLGYYRMPAIHGDTIVFVAEGDLWRVHRDGGRATRLTSHPGEERQPAISSDGKSLAFSASYEGPRDVYTMPLDGGLPERQTYDGMAISFVGWSADGDLLIGSDAGTERGSARLARINPRTGERTPIPLAEAAEGTILSDGRTLIFTRLEFQGSHTDRYEGGTAQQLWRFTIPPVGERGAEAAPLTADYAGTSYRPLTDVTSTDGRVYFTSDRSGRMNIWSMTADGSDLRQLTDHTEHDIGSSSVHGGHVAYQLGPDLWIAETAAGAPRRLSITLDSDFDQTREYWVTEPWKSPSAMAISPEGDRVALVSRGRVFTAPVKQGRTVDVDPRSGIRYRDVAFIDDATLVAISDESGELELVTLPVNGIGAPVQLTSDGSTLRWEVKPSPDGKRIAHTDKRLRLWVFDRDTKENTLVDENAIDDLGDLAWSGDSRWLAYVAPASNGFRQIKLWSSDSELAPKVPFVVTTDRFESFRPQWSPDGKWLWFLSDRTFRTVVASPWGPRQPEPFFDKATKIYALSLKAGTRFPFQPDDELERARAKREAEEKRKDKDTDKDKQKPGPQPEPTPEQKPEPREEETQQTPAPQPGESEPGRAESAPADAPSTAADKAAKEAVRVEIDLDGLSDRVFEVPVASANMSSLLANDKALFWIASERGSREGGALMGLAIGNEKPEPKPVLTGVRSARLSGDRKKLLIGKSDSWQIVDAAAAPANDKSPVADLSAVAIRLSPRQEWRQMAIDAWRLLRDYFYDQNMHGADWRAVLDSYLPWVDRVRSREELSDVLQEMTGELAALHHFVSGGDIRRGRERVEVATLGADLIRDAAAGGWRVTSIPSFDPDEPTARPPLTVPGVDVGVGDVILAIDGTPTLDVAHPSSLLRQKAGRQTHLRVLPKSAQTADEAREVIVRPIATSADMDLRYRGWELDRRRKVEEAAPGEFAYLHLRAMGSGDMNDFARDYYPNFNRKALIIDVRGNNGGNIDSWVLSRLMRRPWMYWSQHAGRAPSWNMQWAFHGPMVVLCDANTASDGEAFSEGFRRLGLGKVIGTRTWGGEIWLSSSNRMVDGGIASAGEFGVFDQHGVWLIEGRGVEPDIIVDNLPHASFFGEDAQLAAAIEHLREQLRAQPVSIPPVPARPVKAPPRRNAP